MATFRNRLPRQLYRAVQVRELDRIAIEECGIEGFALMHRAASVVFSTLLDKWPQAKHIIVFAGTGNNGGDGYVVAGIARENGLNAAVIQLGDHGNLKGDALLAQKFASERNASFSIFDESLLKDLTESPSGHTIIVDALLGTGLDRPVSESYAAAISSINALSLPVMAVDVPSGIASDTGQILGLAIQADVTVTFIGLKRGMLTADGLDASGEIIFHDLDVPEQVYSGPGAPVPDCHRIDMNQMARLLHPRSASAHKGDFGHTVVIGGDYGYGGAALMAAEAAVRAGSGLVSLITRSQNRSAAQARRPEVMVMGTEDADAIDSRLTELLAQATVIVIGPGLGKSDWSRRLFQNALQRQLSDGTPLVVDADGLNLLAERSGQQNNTSRRNWILTPHPGEAARLLDCSTVEIQQDRFKAVKRLQMAWGGVCLLKGAGSLISYEPDTGSTEPVTELCSVGNPGMASGGMGDVLSGVTGGLVAQGISLSDSARIACCAHGESADLAAAERGQRGLAATDLFPHLRQLLNPA